MWLVQPEQEAPQTLLGTNRPRIQTYLDKIESSISHFISDLSSSPSRLSGVPFEDEDDVAGLERQFVLAPRSEWEHCTVLVRRLRGSRSRGR